LGENLGAGLFREEGLASAPAGIGQPGQSQLAKPPAPFGHDPPAHTNLAGRFLLRKPVRAGQKDASALHIALRRGGRPDQGFQFMPLNGIHIQNAYRSCHVLRLHQKPISVHLFNEHYTRAMAAIQSGPAIPHPATERFDPVQSFNQFVQLLAKQRAWRRFAHLSNRHAIPDVWMLNQFRERAGVRELRQINERLWEPLLWRSASFRGSRTRALHYTARF
jgi:hypothetical protein